MLAMLTNAMYHLFTLLALNPALVERYRGHLPCSFLAALGLEDDQCRESEPHGFPRLAN